MGRHRAVKAQDLANKFQTVLREINEAVRVLRKAGRMIGSSKGSPSGYYVPANEQEIKEYMDSFKHELYDMLDTFNKQKRAKAKHLESLVQDQLFPEVKEAEPTTYKQEAGQFGFLFVGPA